MPDGYADTVVAWTLSTAQAMCGPPVRPYPPGVDLPAHLAECARAARVSVYLIGVHDGLAAALRPSWAFCMAVVRPCASLWLWWLDVYPQTKPKQRDGNLGAI